MPEEIYKKIFSKNLNHYMEINQKSQTDIINDLGFNKSAVSTWCNGTRLPRMDKVEALAKYFGINRSDLIEEKNNSETSDEPYYLNDETRQIAQEAFENPELRTLFHSSGRTLIDNYLQLSDTNKKKVVNYSDNLLAIQRAEEEQLHLIPDAAHDRTDISDSDRTEASFQNDENIMNDPNF